MKVYTSNRFIRDGEAIGIFRSEQHHIEPRHQHEFIEMVYVLSGSAVQIVDEQEYEVHRGDMIFINYGSVHAFSELKNFRYCNICFSPEVVSDTIITPDNAFALLSLTAFDEMRKDQNGGRVTFSGRECVEIENILQAMLEEYESDQPLSDKVMENYMNILITKMLRKSPPGMGQETKDIWQELSEYIEQNPDAELTLSALASKCFYNPSYFSRMFKQKFHMSLTEYVTRKRVEYAIRLLSDSSLSVDEISQKTGFVDRSTFYAAFSRITGTTPAQYRSSNRV
ncbi:MAG: helix-turn-helix domain-containing protein [Butyricicoccus sp.]|nr:helix-turn-helix domain-containing protein [Butyricicoccus sp.]